MRFWKHNFLNFSNTLKFSQSFDKIQDVIVIGGGCFGASLAYHLVKYGGKNVLLLEKSELTAGSTWHAAGLVAYYHPGINMKRVHYESLELYKTLEDETGKAVGLHTPGSIRLITTKLRKEEMDYQMSRQGWNQAKQWVISPQEIKEMCPIINIEKVIAGLYNPGDGHIDPYSLTISLAEGAKLMGATIVQASPVTSLQPEYSSRNGLKKFDHWAVETKSGTVHKARHIVNCAGLWASEVNKLAGLAQSPMVQIHHQYVITTPLDVVKALPREMPVIRDLEASYYLRQERNGILIGPYEHPDSMKMSTEWAIEGVPQGFGKELFAPDVDRIMPHLEKAMDLIPDLRNAAIKTCVCGPIMYSPDVLPLVGPQLGLPNYWIGAGSGYGIIHAGGIGSYLAKWILEGEPPYDLLECDPNRFKSTWADQEYVFAKARESYGMNNGIYYPKEQRAAGRPSKRATQLSRYLKERRGARQGFVNGWEQSLYFVPPPRGDDGRYKNLAALGAAVYSTLPEFKRGQWFANSEREALNLLAGVGITDLSTFGKFAVSGKDSAPFLDHVFANRLPKIGRTNISHSVAPLSGKVYSEMTVSRFSDFDFLLLTGSGSELHDERWLEYHARQNGFSDLEIRNVTDDMSCIGLAGPLSCRVLGRISCSRDFDLDAFEKWPFLANESLDMAGVPVIAIRVSYSGEMGWELYHSPKDSVKLYQALLESGEEYGIQDFGAYAMNSLRIEKGFRAWGQEMNMDKDPYEAGLDAFIKLDKGNDFLGKSTLLKISQARKASGDLKKSLCYLTVDGNVPDSIDPEGNESLWHSGKVVGNTTSGAFGFQVGKSVCMAYLPQHLIDRGHDLDLKLELLGKMYPTTVHASPLVETEQVRSRKMKTGKGLFSMSRESEFV